MKRNGKTNTKTISIIAVIFLLLSGFAILFLALQNKRNVDDVPNITQTQVQTQEKAKEFKTVFVEGIVQEIDSSSIIIKNDASTISLILAESFVVRDVTSTKNGSESLESIKGKKVKVEINQENSMVTLIEPLQ